MLNPTCLLIDDSEEIHFVIKKTLIDICEVSSAFTFAEARRQFELKNFDIIIIDLILKEHNGMDLLKEFKESKGALKKTRFFIMDNHLVYLGSVLLSLFNNQHAV